MQVKETKNEGLKREFTVKLPAQLLNSKAELRLVSMSKNMKLDGFRPGKIPMGVLKKRFGKNILGEVVELSVNESSQDILRDKKLAPAMTPKIEILSYKEGEDLDYKMELEVLPEVPEVDFSKITLEKLTCDIEDKDIDEAIEKLAERNKVFTKIEDAKAKAKKGDKVVIDFSGSIDGEKFEGGTAEKFPLELGSGSFIAGFEDQLIGTKAGDDVTVKATFPENYHKQDLAGKPAEFAVHVHEIQTGESAVADDEFAKKFGFKDLAALKDSVKAQFAGDAEATARMKVKKELFDKLDEKTDFVVPACMFDAEFNSIWKSVEQAKKEGDEDLKDKSEETLRKEYTKIAERRVRLGILLSSIALKQGLKVTQNELSQAVMQQARQYPGQERVIFDFYKKNPQQLQELRGPILEEKAVDFIIGQAKVTERKVSRAELMDDSDEENTSGQKVKETKAKKKTAKK